MDFIFFGDDNNFWPGLNESYTFGRWHCLLAWCLYSSTKAESQRNVSERNVRLKAVLAVGQHLFSFYFVFVISFLNSFEKKWTFNSPFKTSNISKSFYFYQTKNSQWNSFIKIFLIQKCKQLLNNHLSSLFMFKSIFSDLGNFSVFEKQWKIKENWKTKNREIRNETIWK